MSAFLLYYRRSFRSFLQFHVSEFFCNRFRLFPGCSFILLRMNCFEHQRNLLDLCPRYRRKHIAIKVNDTALIPGFREDFTGCFEHTEALIANNELDALQSAVAQPLKNSFQLSLSSFIPSAAPRTSRYPSSLTAMATRMATFSYSPPQFRFR